MTVFPAVAGGPFTDPSEVNQSWKKGGSGLSGPELLRTLGRFIKPGLGADVEWPEPYRRADRKK